MTQLNIATDKDIKELRSDLHAISDKMANFNIFSNVLMSDVPKLYNASQAAKFVGLNYKTFKKKYIDTGIIKPLNETGTDDYTIFDLMRLLRFPEVKKDISEAYRQIQGERNE